MLVRNLFSYFYQYFCLETFFLIKTGILYFCASPLPSTTWIYIPAVPVMVMSLLRIFLEGDHSKQTYEDPTKPMTYQHMLYVSVSVVV
jgi:hypothetical protein